MEFARLKFHVYHGYIIVRSAEVYLACVVLYVLGHKTVIMHFLVIRLTLDNCLSIHATILQPSSVNLSSDQLLMLLAEEIDNYD